MTSFTELCGHTPSCHTQLLPVNGIMHLFCFLSRLNRPIKNDTHLNVSGTINNDTSLSPQVRFLRRLWRGEGWGVAPPRSPVLTSCAGEAPVRKRVACPPRLRGATAERAGRRPRRDGPRGDIGRRPPPAVAMSIGRRGGRARHALDQSVGGSLGFHHFWGSCAWRNMGRQAGREH